MSLGLQYVHFYYENYSRDPSNSLKGKNVNTSVFTKKQNYKGRQKQNIITICLSCLSVCDSAFVMQVCVGLGWDNRENERPVF